MHHRVPRQNICAKAGTSLSLLGPFTSNGPICTVEAGVDWAPRAS